MFALTRPYRQSVATAILVISTVVPTAYVGLTAWRIGRPGHRHEVEAEIGRALGLRVAIDAVRYPRPGEVEYRGVVLSHEEPNRKGATEVARAAVVRLRRGDRELQIDAVGLKLRGDGPKAAVAQAGTILKRSGSADYERISFSAPTCEIDLGAGITSYILKELVGQLSSNPAAPCVQASYRVIADRKGETNGTRCELTLTRDRQREPVRTTVAFKTMEGLPLPALVLDPFFDSASWLGPEAKVDGALTLTQAGAADWAAEFQGDLIDIDFDALMSQRFPSHRLHGKARLSIETARWDDRPGQGFGWVEARGELTGGPGVVGFGLLQALRTEMKFRPSIRVARTVSAGQIDLNFQSIAFSFAMTGDGEIKVAGGLGNEFAADAVLVEGKETLVYAPEGTANVRGLIKTLVPVTAINRAHMVPLTERSRILLALPVPPDAAASRPIGGN